jgi:hypothetical protein
MPTRYTVSRTISAPLETIWKLLTDAAGYKAWNDAVLSVEGTIAVGSTIRLVSVANPKRAFKLTVVSMNAPREMIWADSMPLGLFKGTRTYLIERSETSTTFSMTEEFTGLLAPLITKSIPDLTDSFNMFADSLKIAAEKTTL